MHNEPTQSAIERDNETDGTVLMVLLSDESHRPWAVDEIAREMGYDVTDSLRRLYGGGLIHRVEGFVWASRAAVMADQIEAT
jgi:predicted transcriptional regulator